MFGHGTDELLNAPDFVEREWNDDDYGGEEYNELQYVRYHHGTKSPDRNVKDTDATYQQDTGCEGQPRRNFENLAYRVEERAGREHRYE